jgi:hypothetical protein
MLSGAPKIVRIMKFTKRQFGISRLLVLFRRLKAEDWNFGPAKIPTLEERPNRRALRRRNNHKPPCAFLSQTGVKN